MNNQPHQDDLPPEIQQLEAIQSRLNKWSGINQTPPGDKPSRVANPQAGKAQWGYLEIGEAAAWIVGILTFLGAYIYCVVTYGFLLGMGLGWLPSGILAAIVGIITIFLWLPALIVAGIATSYFLSVMGYPGPAAASGLILLFVIAMIFRGIQR